MDRERHEHAVACWTASGRPKARTARAAAAAGLAPLCCSIQLANPAWLRMLPPGVAGKEEGEDADYLQAVRNVYRSLSPEVSLH